MTQYKYKPNDWIFRGTIYLKKIISTNLICYFLPQRPTKSFHFLGRQVGFEARRKAKKTSDRCEETRAIGWNISDIIQFLVVSTFRYFLSENKYQTTSITTTRKGWLLITWKITNLLSRDLVETVVGKAGMSQITMWNYKLSCFEE